MVQSQNNHLDTKNDNLYLIFDEWPSHFAAANKMKIELQHTSDFYHNIVLCGMGGSATSCDIIHEIFVQHGNIPLSVMRGNHMPSWVENHSLVFVKSASGNTEESIFMVEEASKKGAEVISISSGGRLKEISLALGQNHLAIPNLGLPRACLPYLLVPVLKVIDNFLHHSLMQELNLMESSLSAIRESNDSRVPFQENLSKKIAHFLVNGFVFCFSSPSLMAAATRLKNSLNENAKLHCIRESVLEASHNEIVPFTFSPENTDRRVLLLRWIKDSQMICQRFARIMSFLTEIGEQVWELTIPEQSHLNAMLSAIYLLDYSTIYLAKALDIDPSPTPAIDILKSRNRL